MYLNHEKTLEKYWVLDIEADSLTPTRIWVVVAENAATGEVLTFLDPEQFNRFVAANRDSYFVGHSFLSYDVPNLNRLWGSDIPFDRVVDTLVLSYLYDPRMPGGHSLKAWGDRMKFPKLAHEDWSQYSPEILERCKQDVRLTKRVFLALTKRMAARGFSEKSCKIEHDIRVVVDKQERNGFHFDIQGAERLHQRVASELAALAEPIRELFPPVLVSNGTYQYRTKADGAPYASFERHLSTYPKLVLSEDQRSYEVFDWQEFNIGSPQQRLAKLLSIGFKPTKKTKNGNPSVDEDSLVEFANSKKGVPEAQAIADWLVLSGRASMLQTWLNAVNREDSRIHGQVFTCGAITRRMTHSSPNTANIPKAKPKVKYGKECRQLWTVADTTNRRLVGYDAKGLEMRMFGHYLRDPVAAELYIHGDPHAVNTANLGLAPEERDLIVKNVFYAFLYGATDRRLDATANKGKGFGKKAREILMKTTPGLENALYEVQEEQKTGWIQTIDGGYVRCLSPHAALNSKLQSAGGITMKVASIILDGWCEKKGIDQMKVGDIHDEGQHDVLHSDAEEFGRLAVASIVASGEELGFSVPLDGDYKIGLSWAETH
jgi:DNA polymerase I-like protein with 3'-5' exonuclease and polymerase domains